MKLSFFQDPGHGWVKVSKALLVKLGIADKITPYSYQRGEFAYLEEDCDAGTLIDAAKAAGITIELVSRHSNGRSRIRNYDVYRGHS